MSTSAAWSQRWWLPWHLYSDDPRRAGRLTDPFWSSPGSMDPPGRLPWLTALPLETRKCLAVGRLCWVRHACSSLSATDGLTRGRLSRPWDGGVYPPPGPRPRRGRGSPPWYPLVVRGGPPRPRHCLCLPPVEPPSAAYAAHWRLPPASFSARHTTADESYTSRRGGGQGLRARGAYPHTVRTRHGDRWRWGTPLFFSFFFLSSTWFFFSFVCAVGRGLPASAAGGRPAVS